MVRKVVSNNVIRRLPRYLRKLEELKAQGVTRISSKEFGDMLGLTPSQIRQDLSHFGEFGQQGYGYSTEHLSREIEKIVGMDRGYRAILIGVGNIGRALIDKFSFHEWGFSLVRAFDIGSEIVGTKINGVTVQHADTLEVFLQETPVDVAVLCVSKDSALATAKLLTEHGIEAIWNFTNVDILEPYCRTLVENVHFSDSLLSLGYYLTELKDSKYE